MDERPSLWAMLRNKSSRLLPEHVVARRITPTGPPEIHRPGLEKILMTGVWRRACCGQEMPSLRRHCDALVLDAGT